jgi:hypothetical protein
MTGGMGSLHNRPMRTRGRPPKFGRPANLLALTLPQDTIDRLQAIDPDLGWAIVKLVEGRGHVVPDTDAGEEPSDVELVPIGTEQFLIVVRAHEAFASLPGVDLVPLGHGRAFLAFERSRSIESLELALIDRLEDDSVSLDDRARYASFREVLRGWRHDDTLVFEERAIVMVHRATPPRRR